MEAEPMAAGRSRVEVTVRRNPLLGWFVDRSVNAKSLAAAALVAAVAVGVGGLAVNRMTELNEDLRAMKAVSVDSERQLGDLRGGMGTMFRGLYLLANADAGLRTQGRDEVIRSDSAVAAALAAYRALPDGTPARTAALAAFASAWADHTALRDAAVVREPPPAGTTMPDPQRVGAAFADAELRMRAALGDLARQADATATEMTAHAAVKAHTARNLIVGVLAVGLAFALLVGLWIARVMRRQLGEATGALAALAEGDLSRTAQVRSRDELGVMAAAVNRATGGIRDTVTALAAGARTLAESSHRLTGVTGRIGASAQEAAAQANLVASAAGDVSTNVRTVAAGSAEMGSSIRQIAENANDAARVASEAVGVADATNRTVSKLGDSSVEIGNVVKVITSIAGQTNLLALNATIEAARAGEAGKGFAVVANEVKELAQETARATGDISRRVEAIQSDATDAVAAIGEIGRIITRINAYQLTIASAVAEQTATTGEMSRNVGDAAAGASDIATNITGVAQATRETSATLADAERTATDLATLAAELQAMVGRFRL
jgi:methyl-accepting chemotaxis protein